MHLVTHNDKASHTTFIYAPNMLDPRMGRDRKAVGPVSMCAYSPTHTHTHSPGTDKAVPFGK